LRELPLQIAQRLHGGQRRAPVASRSRPKIARCGSFGYLFQANESAPTFMPLFAPNTDRKETLRRECTANNNPRTSF
jgi:hypothetical protein